MVLRAVLFFLLSFFSILLPPQHALDQACARVPEHCSELEPIETFQNLVLNARVTEHCSGFIKGSTAKSFELEPIETFQKKL